MSLGVASADSTGQSTQSSSPQPQGTGQPSPSPTGQNQTGGPSPNPSPSPTQNQNQTQNPPTGARKTPQGGMVRQGPKGPEHKHPGYPPGSGPGTGKAMKWHLVSQKHGSAEQTQQMHVQAGLGKDGLGGNRQMRESVGANADAGGGIMPAPQPDTMGQKLGQKLDSKFGEGASQKLSTGARFAGLAALGAVQGFGDLAGKGFNMVNRFIQSVLSGNPLSPASTMLANTLDGMAGVNQSIRDTYDRYGVAMGVDMDSIAETVKGRQLKKDLELQEDGHNMAFEAVDNTLINVAGYQGINGEPPKLEDLGPHQLQRVNDELGQQADALMDRLYQGREDGTLTDDEEKRIKAALEVYERGFDAIARQGDANAKKFKEQAKEIRAARALNRQMEAEIRRQAKEQKAQDNAQKLATAKQNGDYASVVLYQMGEKYYDTELTQSGVPVNDGVRKKFENELEDKIESGNYSQSEVQSMEARLRECREFGRKKEADAKQRAREGRMNFDYTDTNFDGVRQALEDNHALDSKATDEFGTVGGQDMSPRLHEYMDRNSNMRKEQLTRKYLPQATRRARNAIIQKLQAAGAYDPTSPRVMNLVDKLSQQYGYRDAESMAESDDEVRRSRTAATVQEWRYSTDQLDRALAYIPYKKLEENGKTIADVDAARQEIKDAYKEMGEKYRFVKDANGNWGTVDPRTGLKVVPTDEDREFMKKLNQRIRTEFGLSSPPKARKQQQESQPQTPMQPQSPTQPPNNSGGGGGGQPSPKNPVVIQVGGQNYTQNQIKRIIGATPSGVPYIVKPTQAQMRNAVMYNKTIPSRAKDGKNMVLLSKKACNAIERDYPDEIRRLEANGDPMDAEAAKEMRKYLAYARDYKAFAEISTQIENSKGTGEWDEEGFDKAYLDFMRNEGRAWMDPNAPAPPLDDLQGPSEYLEKLRQQFQITPIEQDASPDTTTGAQDTTTTAEDGTDTVETDTTEPVESVEEPSEPAEEPSETVETTNGAEETGETAPDEEPVWWDKVYLNGNPYLKSLPDEEIELKYDDIGTLNDDIKAFRSARSDFPESLNDLADRISSQADNLAIERTRRGLEGDESNSSKAKRTFLERQSDENLEKYTEMAQKRIAELSEKPDLTPEEQRELIESMGTFGYAINEYKRRLNQPEKEPEPPKTEEKASEKPEIPPETPKNEVETPEIPPETEAEKPSEEVSEEPSETVETPEIQAETEEIPAETVENEENKPKTYLSDRVVGEGDKVSITDTLPPVTMVDKDGNTVPVVSTTDAQKKGLVLLGVLKEKDAANLKEYPQTQKAFKLQEQYLRSHLAQMGYEKQVRGINFAHEPFYVAMSLMNDLVSSVPETQWSDEERQRYSDLQDMVNAATDNVKHALDRELRNRKDRETREKNAAKGTKLYDSPQRGSVYSVADMDASDRLGSENRTKADIYNTNKEQMSELARKYGMDPGKVLEELESSIRAGVNPNTGERMSWYDDSKDYSPEQLADFMDSTNLEMLSNSKQEAIRALTDTLNSEVREYLESRPELAQKLKEAYPDEEPSDAAIRHPEALGDARNDVQKMMGRFASGMGDVLQSKYKRAYRRAKWLGVEDGDFEAVMSLMDPAVTSKNIKNTKKKMYSYKKSQFTPEGWEALMKANDMYMRELERAYQLERRKDGGLNVSLEGKDKNASPGMLMALNADKASNPWVKRLADDYWYDMHLLMERGLKANQGKPAWTPKPLEALYAKRSEEAKAKAEAEAPEKTVETPKPSRKDALKNRTPRKVGGGQKPMPGYMREKKDEEGNRTLHLVNTSGYVPLEGSPETLQNDRKLKFIPTDEERSAIDRNWALMNELGVDSADAEYLAQQSARMDHSEGRRVGDMNPASIRDYLDQMGILTPEYAEALRQVEWYQEDNS